ncbi:universal stress protein [Oceanicoccus sp. KOV_DT_Chl]|uniref:universal stress protein n=1 Tax=Oceanicoccus sp. KOV_DT_Chl TaxID=1904639 RepID=UPI000C79A926|nr:universal stress protein [Oceanicoccus sp. KOV_DT_Chl]
MSQYNTILLASDLSDEAEQVADKAMAVAKANGASLHLIHVIEPLSFAYGGDIPMDFSGIQEEMQKQAEAQMSDFAKRYNINPEHQHIVIGRPESEIHNLVKKLSVDLVVVGSHGRHGIALLLGSTANAVLHGATCDVLAVRVGE